MVFFVSVLWLDKIVSAKVNSRLSVRSTFLRGGVNINININKTISKRNKQRRQKDKERLRAPPSQNSDWLCCAAPKETKTGDHPAEDHYSIIAFGVLNAEGRSLLENRILLRTIMDRSWYTIDRHSQSVDNQGKAVNKDENAEYVNRLTSSFVIWRSSLVIGRVQPSNGCCAVWLWVLGGETELNCWPWRRTPRRLSLLLSLILFCYSPSR